MKTKKPVDSEIYKGYKIVLESFDWGARFRVIAPSGNVRKFDDRSSAKSWIDGMNETAEGTKE